MFRESLISAFLCRYEINEQYTEHDKDIALLIDNEADRLIDKKVWFLKYKTIKHCDTTM